MNYAGFTIERRHGLFHAVRRTKTAIYRLSPKRTLMEIHASIREHLASLTVDDLFAI